MSVWWIRKVAVLVDHAGRDRAIGKSVLQEFANFENIWLLVVWVMMF
jgi:hypothetical protein